MNNLTAEKIKDNPFAACYEFGNSLGLQELKEAEYIGLFIKGDFPLHDYGTGFLWVNIYTMADLASTGFYTRLYIGNADDGEYGAWVYHKTAEASDTLVLKIVEVFNVNFSKVLPSLDVLNAELVKVGVYVVPE